MKKNWYYAVKVGRNPGIYQRWEQCWVQIKEYPQAVWTKFGSYTEAENYVYGSNITGSDANETIIEPIDPDRVVSSTPAVSKTLNPISGSTSSPIEISEDENTILAYESTNPTPSCSNGMVRQGNKRIKKSVRPGNKGKISVKIKNPRYDIKSIVINDVSSDDEDIEFIENPLKESQVNRTSSDEFFKVGTSEEEVAVGVFWDIENICIPSGLNPAIFVTKIREMFASDTSKYCEKNFFVVCDVWRESKFIMKQLHEFHVRIIHVPGLKQNSSDNVLRDIMNEFVNYNKYSRIVLISGDSDFSHDIHNFRRNKKCECILVHNKQAKQSLIKSANKAFLYQDLIREHHADNSTNQKGKKRSRLEGRSDQADESMKKKVYYRNKKRKILTPRKRLFGSKLSKRK